MLGADFGLSPPTITEKSERKKSVKTQTLWQKLAQKQYKKVF